MIFVLDFFNKNNIKKVILSLLITLVCLTPALCKTSTNKIILSESAEVSLLTSSPGEELYSIFGHSALRVKDTLNNIDLAYNYGTFNFNTPNFYLKFAQGKLLYKLSVSSYRQYEPQYRFEGRSIYEQVLNLNRQEKQRIFDFLQENALPENRYYHYDFFYDNCATRIRDIVDNLFEVDWYEEPYKKYDKTFRDLINAYLKILPWSKFGIDILLGLPADKVATPYEYMFLPDEMHLAFDMAMMADGSPLVKEHSILLEKGWPLPPPNPVNPVIGFWFIFIIGLLSFINKWFEKYFDMVYFSVISLLGLVIIFFWFFAEHTATKINMNLLWALPTHIYFFARYHFSKSNNYSKWYFICIMIITGFLIVLWSFLPQGFNSAFFPVILMIFLKSIPPALNINYGNIFNSITGKQN